MPLLDPFDIADLQSEVAPALDSTCDVQRAGAAGGPDAWGSTQATFAVVLASIPARYYVARSGVVAGPAATTPVFDEMVYLGTTQLVQPRDRLVLTGPAYPSGRTFEIVALNNTGLGWECHVRGVQ